MFCDEGLPFSLCSSILLFIALSLESVPLVIGILILTYFNNTSVQAYTIKLDDEVKSDDKRSIAIKQKYKCFNYADVVEDDKYKCLLKDGVFDEAGYKMLGGKVYCPMCYSAIRNASPKNNIVNN
jgi:hypothetical protein